MPSEASKLASDNQNANFCYADVNCRLKIRWNDNVGMIIRKISLTHFRI